MVHYASRVSKQSIHSWIRDLNMKINEIKECSFQKWYKDFQEETIESIVLPLPEGFVQYILKDGIVLPKSFTPCTIDTNSDESDSEIDWENSSGQEAVPPNFSEFDENINNAIASLGGKVFPKLNWSSPKDAAWISFNNSLCCTSVSEIYLLLKSSDFIVHDLTKALQQCEDFKCKDNAENLMLQSNEEFYLVLRKWVEIDVSGEFRCFVKDNVLIGICQREESLYFDYLQVKKSSIIDDITYFFNKNIQFKFPLSSYTFDVFRPKKEKVFLVDFNPFGKVTDSLLFSWSELTDGTILKQARDQNSPVFLYINENSGIRPQTLSYHAIPRDIVDISTGQDSFKLVDLMKLKIEEQNQELSSDEEK